MKPLMISPWSALSRFAAGGGCAVVLASSLAVCAPSLAERDRAAVTRMRDAARRSPGPRQARDLAEMVNSAARDGAYAKDPGGLNRDASEAIASLDAASSAGGPDVATLVAWKGIMLGHLGHAADSLQELKRSMSIAPNLVAARKLLEIYGPANRRGEVGEVCASTVPVIDDASERFSLIEKCMESMNALTSQSALSWASPEIIAWYEEEQSRREAEDFAAGQHRAEREAFEQHIVRQAQACTARCREEGLRCQNECTRDQACEHRCTGINRACVDRCEARARMRLGR